MHETCRMELVAHTADGPHTMCVFTPDHDGLSELMVTPTLTVSEYRRLSSWLSLMAEGMTAYKPGEPCLLTPSVRNATCMR